ncbi:DedA family protein [Roseomonas gilardii]|uniref:DedA family protein n=1 Tax=Roseomonas gilardii TaxID=257708 RepID=A0A1L7ABI5_9PROT|nr:DedA family protein [Roseomonas gilardii]PZP42733.1 MAG: DedA family protein [Azospirillum brasilense]APT56146.1 SNARE-like domain protein [Roseomonas gilardii]MDT8333112.1 DedA family protein [Roseomonas gilardii]PZR09207.1 MAG: DedA family protein [Azospirillum brasilense]SUE63024.1 Inner membrane protein yabI [Roseomonas gilardii subsp. rosea]
MDALISGFEAWIRENAAWAPWVAMLLAFSESLPVISLLVPSTALLLGMGLLIGNGTLPAWPVLLGIVVGGVAGDAVGFWAFRWQGRRLLRRWLPRRQWRNYASAVLFFRRWGWMAVFASRFVGPARAFASAIAGLSGMRQSHFQAANLCSAIVWAPLLVMPGYLLDALGALFLRPGGWVILLLVAVPAIGGWSLLRRR